MTLIAGESMPEGAWHDLCAIAESLDGLDVRRKMDNPAADYASCSWIVCHVDRDSALDVLAAGVPALLVPAADERQDEQVDRGRRLAHWGVGQVLMPHLLNGVSLANSLHQMIHAKCTAPEFNLDGAEISANILYHLLMSDESRPRDENAIALTDWLRPH